MPVEVEVESEVTLLSTVESPVESELTPVDSEPIPVEVDVESELTPVASELAAVDSCCTSTASVATTPGATLVIWRSAPALPTETSPTELKVPVRP